MSSQGRSQHGQFAAKSDEPRQVRSVRLTDSAWEQLGELAVSRCITRTDLVEQFIEAGLAGGTAATGLSLEQLQAVVSSILNDPVVTRNGKDRGSVRRAFESLMKSLS